MHLPWIIAGLILLGAVALRSLVLRRRQVRELEKLARGRRMTFSPDDLIGVQERYAALELLQRGHARHALDLLYGSTESGLLTVFRFTCEVGFGSHRAVETWWFAVVETPDAHDPWRATPADEADAQDASIRVGAFRCRFRHQQTLEAIGLPALTGVLNALAPDAWVEVRGHLVAVAAPADGDGSIAGRVLDDVMRVVDFLASKEG